MALSADRNTPTKDGVEFVYPCAASKTFYAGALVVLDTSGNAEPATAATGKIGAGVCQKYVVSGGVAAVETVTVRSGMFRFVNGETITKAHIGDAAYADDDQTIYRTATGRSQIGTISDVDSLGVWVTIGAPLAAATVGLLAANNLSDVGTAATALTNIGGDKRYIALRATDVVGANAKRYGFVAPAAGTITKVRSVLLGAALTTGDCTLTGKINTVAITNGALTVTQSGSAIGDVDVATPTAARTVAAGDFVEFLVGGTNAQATSFVEIIVELTLS